MTKSFVVVKFDDGGKYRIWRDYGETWGSPIYAVLDYFDSHKEAREFVRWAKENDRFPYVSDGDASND